MSDSPRPTNAPIGIVVAMDAELRHLVERIAVMREERDDIWLDRYAEAGGHHLVLVRSGMGMVNAAAATERLIYRHRPRAIINFGCSGAHRREILSGDVVIGDRSVNHGAVHILASGEELYKGVAYEVGGETMAPSDLRSDPELLGLAHRAAQGWTPEPWPREAGWPESVPYREPRVHTGAVASADIWTQAHARLDVLHGRHGTFCEDMEAAAIAQVCAMHETPFVPIKDISNNEYHAATDLAGDFAEFPTAEVGKRAASLVLRMLGAGD
ncbi:MAG TPA: 5'-methylthioadenosine/S-adenosylhomocysteine nucleosidase [Thermomicrobiales bacterium]|nr:5'-methylthioadenosine/S-adenosylhomocysteine nucleosidase [Thermomicrobiales bacterium]